MSGLSEQTLRFARLVEEVEAFGAAQGVKLEITPRIRRAIAPLDRPPGMPEEDFEAALERVKDECEIQVARLKRAG